MQKLIKEIKKCSQCIDLPLGPNPLFQIHSEAKILIISQAPGMKAHESGIPWSDDSGTRLRKWMDISDETFYGKKIAILPMGLCYPGKGARGDLPPRKECFTLWHEKIIKKLSHLELILLVGNYSQQSYLKNSKKESLTKTVYAFKEYAPKFFPLPHPSALNNIWLSKNLWFESLIVPELQKTIENVLRE
jgi:uracil-DNA glycosylase